MLSRLTALILTVCVGLPMCWCCIVAPQREEAAGCCAMKQHAVSGHPQEHSKEQNCPCLRHEATRDVASTFVQAPAPVLKLLAELGWVISALTGADTAVFKSPAPRHDHGPPLRAAPLYARHCSLLI